MACTKLTAQNMTNFKWEYRILIIKELHTGSQEFKDQEEHFRNSNKEFKERKLLLLTISNDKYTVFNFETNSSMISGKLSENMPKTILDNSNNFEVILIGLDGSIKLRQENILLKEDLFRIIDSMPMRISEMGN